MNFSFFFSLVPQKVLILFLICISLFGGVTYAEDWVNSGLLNYNMGKIGIGTDLPTQRLDVKGNIRIHSDARYSFLQLGSDTHDRIYVDDSPKKYFGGGLFFRVQNGDVASHYYDSLVLADTGNVGIGVKNPDSRLDIHRGKNLMNLKLSSPNGAVTFDVASGTGLANIVAGAAINTDGGGYHFLTGRGASRIQLHDGEISLFTSDVTEGTKDAIVKGFKKKRFTVNNHGNVGVGVNTPVERLDIGGNIKLSGNILSDGDICIGNCSGAVAE